MSFPKYSTSSPTAIEFCGYEFTRDGKEQKEDGNGELRARYRCNQRKKGCNFTLYIYNNRDQQGNVKFFVKEGSKHTHPTKQQEKERKELEARKRKEEEKQKAKALRQQKQQQKQQEKEETARKALEEKKQKEEKKRVD